MCQREIIRTAFVVFVCGALIAAAKDQGQPAKTTAGEARFKSLVEEYDRGGQPQEFASKFVQLAREYPKDPIAVDALAWVIKNLRRGDELNQAIAMLEKDLVASDRLAPVCQAVVRRPSLAGEKLLRTLLKKSPHQIVQAQACFQLAVLLQKKEILIEGMNDRPDQIKRVTQYYGKELVDHLNSLDRKALANEIEKLFERVAQSFAKVETPDGTMGELAVKRLFALRHLAIGKPAPEIAGEDIDGKTLKLSQYRGKVVLLDFWGNW